MQTERKRYLCANGFQEDSWRLAAAVRASGWRPDAIIGLWRGGAHAGVSVHEFLKATGWSARHMPLKCSSYTGIGKNAAQVEFAFGEALFGTLSPGEKVLVVDDVLDTGNTARAVRAKMSEIGVEMRLATVYWKSAGSGGTMRPDYFVRDLGDEWIVFPHEIDGLTDAEAAEKSALLADLLARSRNAR